MENSPQKYNNPPSACVFVHPGDSGIGGASPPLVPSPSRPMKRLRENVEDSPVELVRCKRRLNFPYALPQQQPAAVARRNERERNRVKQVNVGFTQLKEQLPNPERNKKMSKVETLKAAADYIKYMQRLLHEADAVNAAFSMAPQPSFCSNSASPTPSYNSYRSYTSDGSSSSCEPLSAEEEDLLDFAAWF